MIFDEWAIENSVGAGVAVSNFDGRTGKGLQENVEMDTKINNVDKVIERYLETDIIL